MAELIRLTESVAHVTVGTTDQPLYTAVDVLAYDIVDVLATAAFELPASPSPSLTLYLLSGMQCASADNWVQLTTSIGTFTSASSAAVNYSGGFYRYLRWRATLSGVVSSAQFTIELIGRKTG